MEREPVSTSSFSSVRASVYLSPLLFQGSGFLNTFARQRINEIEAALEKLALTLPTSCGRSIGIVRSRTKATKLVS
jgi:hypothetical protein